MNLREIAEQCLRDSEDWFPDVARSPHHHVLSITGEWGEYCNLLKKVERGSITFEEALPMLREELIDVFIYMFNLAAVMGVDIEKEYNVKRERNVERFGNSSGTAR